MGYSLALPRSRTWQKRPGMPIGIDPWLAPRGLLYCWPFANAGFTELLQGLAPFAKGSTPPTFGPSPLGAGCVMADVLNNTWLNYRIKFPSLTTPFSIESVIWLKSALGANFYDVMQTWDTSSESTTASGAFGITSDALGTNDKGWNAEGSYTSTGAAAKTLNNVVQTVGYNHVVATWNGVTLTIYVNGASKATVALASPLVGSTAFLYFGAANAGDHSIPGVYLLANMATVAWSATEVFNRFAHPFDFLLYQEDMFTGTTYSQAGLQLLGSSGGMLTGSSTPVFPGMLQMRSTAQETSQAAGNFPTALTARSGSQSQEVAAQSYLKALLGRGISQVKARVSTLYTGVLSGLSGAELNGAATTRATTSLLARTMAQGKAIPNLGAAAIITAVAARSAMISTGRALGSFAGPIFGRAAAVGKALPGLSASSSISSRSMAQGKVAPSVRGLSSLVSQVALMSKGRALAAYSSALSARAATTSQARTAISAATILLARGTAQAKAFGSTNFGVVVLLTRAAAVSMGRALTISKAQLSATSNAQAKSRGLLLGVTALLARGAAQGKALATINFGVLALATRAAGASAGRVVAAAKAQLFAISNSQAKANGLISATISLLARSAAKGKALGSINFGILSLITRAASIGMGRAATSAKAQLATISNSQLQARGLLSATVSLLARGAAQGKAFGNINFGIISLISRSMAKNTGRVAAAYAARLSTTSTSMSKANGLLSATTALLGRGAARSKALPSLILVKALTTLSAAQSKGRVAVAYTAQLGNVTAARLKASGTIRFAGQTASFASSTAVSFGRAALALLPPIVDPARLLVSAGKTRLLLAFGEARSRLLTSSGKARLLMAYGEGRNRLISTLGKLRLLKR